MSLEAAIKDLTEAVKENTAAVKGGAKPAPTSSTKGSSTSSSKGSSSKGSSSKKDITIDDLAEAFGKFMKTGSKDDKERAKKVVLGINEHFDVERISHLEEDNFDEAANLLRAYRDGDDDPLDLFGDGDGDDDGGSPI